MKYFIWLSIKIFTILGFDWHLLDSFTWYFTYYLITVLVVMVKLPPWEQEVIGLNLRWVIMGLNLRQVIPKTLKFETLLPRLSFALRQHSIDWFPHCHINGLEDWYACLQHFDVVSSHFGKKSPWVCTSTQQTIIHTCIFGIYMNLFKD